MSSRLAGSIVARTAIDSELAGRLYSLFAQYYDRVDRRTFDRDLEDKDWVLLLEDGCGTVQGFTTLRLYELTFRSLQIRAVFSGNTIIDRSYWGGQELVRCWCRFMARLKLEAADTRLYWFLICSGYRTYLYLPLFYRSFYPRCGCNTPEFEQALIDFLGRMAFPDEYRNGIVRVAEPRECLQTELAVPAAHKQSNTHVRFFVERNPGYLRGDELVCLTEFSYENTKGLARRAFDEVAALL
jgi:hypothetical protein